MRQGRGCYATPPSNRPLRAHADPIKPSAADAEEFSVDLTAHDKGRREEAVKKLCTLLRMRYAPAEDFDPADLVETPVADDWWTQPHPGAARAALPPSRFLTCPLCHADAVAAKSAALLGDIFGSAGDDEEGAGAGDDGGA